MVTLLLAGQPLRRQVPPNREQLLRNERPFSGDVPLTARAAAEMRGARSMGDRVDDELMTVEQAAAVYDVSPLTLRRRAQYGEIDGAVKLRGRRGQEWRIPAEAMHALGYGRRTPASLNASGLVSTLRKLTQGLADAHRENMRLHRELTEALTERARLSAELDAERRLVDLAGTSTVVDLRDERSDPLPQERGATSG